MILQEQRLKTFNHHISKNATKICRSVRLGLFGNLLSFITCLSSCYLPIACQQVHQGTFACPGRSQDSDKLTWWELSLQTLQDALVTCQTWQLIKQPFLKGFQKCMCKRSNKNFALGLNKKFWSLSIPNALTQEPSSAVSISGLLEFVNDSNLVRKKEKETLSRQPNSFELM